MCVCGGVSWCWGFYNSGEGNTDEYTTSSPFYLEPSPQTPLWSHVGSCVLPAASSVPQRRDTSPYSACPPEAAPGLISGLREREQLIHTHSPCRPDHPDRLNHDLDSFHAAPAKTSLFSSFFCFPSHSCIFRFHSTPSVFPFNFELRNLACVICTRKYSADILALAVLR